MVAGSEALELAGLSAARQLGAARRAGARRRCRRRSRSPIPRPPTRARAELDGVRVLAGDEGVRELIVATRARSRPQRDRRHRRPRPDDRRAQRGDRPGARQQGEPGRRRRAGHRARRGDRAPGSCRSTPSTRRSSSCCAARGPATVERLILTASGGPFRGRTDLDRVTVEEALAHPTWEMGGRITIDSATLMNKGLEVIEAHHLFGVPYERIDVVVHPQSIVHSLIELNDGAQLAHLGLPDMRVPISYALHFPERADVTVPTLDLAAVGKLEFEPPDLETFRLPAARARGRRGGGDRAVRAQRRRRGRGRGLPRRPRSPFTAIAEVIDGALERTRAQPVGHFEELFECDARAREVGRAGWSRQRGHGMSWLLAFAGFVVPDHRPRGRAHRRREGGRDAGRALLPLLPAEALERQARRDRVRDRRDPARRLREDHRDEPRRGARPRGRAARLLPPAGLEADRGDRRRARWSTS